jgi:hypothetical protein
MEGQFIVVAAVDIETTLSQGQLHMAPILVVAQWKA